MDSPLTPSAVPSVIDERSMRAVARGLLEPGLAQRVRMVVRLSALLYPRMYPEGTAGKAADTAQATPAGRVSAGESGASAGVGQALSGEVLGRMLGLSRAAVHKHIDQLRAQGFAIESAAGVGYRLAEPCDDLLVGEAVIPYLLQTFDPDGPWFAGLPYLFQQSSESTNLLLRRNAAGLPAGATAVAEHQSAGRGRLGRTWSDQTGREVMFSVLLRPSLAPGQAHLLSLAAALAVAEAIEVLPGLAGRVKIKWPNDVLIDGGKVCGILVEGSMDADHLHWAVAGIGLNVNSDSAALAGAIEVQADAGPEKRLRPVSLKDSLGTPVARAPFLAALLARLTVTWSGLEEGPPRGHPGAARLLDGLRERDALAGSPVEVYGGAARQEVVASGVAAGIGAEGQLLVRTSAGETVSVVAGDVSLSR